MYYMLAALYYIRMRHCKVGLQLGSSQMYYISRFETEQKKGVQLTITAFGNDADSVQQRSALIEFVGRQLNNIMEVFMPAEKKPIRYIPCPHCPNLHILFDHVGTHICCPFSGLPTPSNYYTDLTPAEKSGEYISLQYIKL